ncbi:MAG: transcriptional repressor [Pseudomonadota bacterium]
MDRLSPPGVRGSPHRQVVADILAASDDHPTAEQILDRAREVREGFSLASVYRALALFKKGGFVIQHDFGDGKARYEIAEPGHHDHLIDTETGDVIEFASEQLDDLLSSIAKANGYTMRDCRIQIYGVKATTK